MKIDNIYFLIHPYHDIQFIFKNDGRRDDAWLQLPDTTDSVHKINGKRYDSYDATKSEIFRTLSDYYFDSFEDVYYAAASALLGVRVDFLQYIKGLYVAYPAEGEPSVIKEKRIRSYSNQTVCFEKHLPDYIKVGEDEFLKEADIIKQADALRWG